LIKHKDKFASSAEVTNKSKSVVSGITLLQLEKSAGSKNGSPKKAVKKVAPKQASPTAKKSLTLTSKKKVNS